MTNPLTDAELERLLLAPEHQDNPLLPALKLLRKREQMHQQRLDRLLRIADCSDDLARTQSHDLLHQYDKQLRRLEKITRISDRYQQNLLELNEELKEVALRDPLTGLANRRLLMSRLNEEIERSRRHQQPLSVVMLDVDHFKRINDVFGHDMGDKALCMMSKAIVQQLRETDLCARWGGEEFMLLLPDTRSEQAIHMVERVMQAIRLLQLRDDQTVSLSISAGITQYHANEAMDVTINRADGALISAKQNGRDQWQWAR
ncbi:biofilm regulation diguanylate cyclase SiaD [Oceanisphaera sp. W20_SRM_FM3]|uniref:biofilm regulation diguanylate cyclase SiaD n=1 Tax=Oceanisphaera sp. W20_SRM_FM3 TaxID=3240267 RepID=UPI003F9A9483